MCSLLFATTVFFLCLFPYRALLNYHEQTHLFRWSSYYLCEQFSSLEGCIEYLISFITQFFYVGWMGAAMLALLALLIQTLTWQIFKAIRMGKAITFPLTFILPSLLYYLYYFPKEYREDELFREEIEYDYLVRSQQWNRVLGKSYNHPPKTTNGIWCTNYALSQKGTLLDDMFFYKQDGPDGLILDALRMQPLALFSLSDIAFSIGLVNTSERYAFDVKQRLPDNHKSGRIYQRLAETNLINGHYKVARKYMQILQSTLFYSGWANHYIQYIGNEEAINSDKMYGVIRKFRQKKNDQLAQSKDQILEELVRENPENKLAADYLLAYELLRLDLEKVTTYTLMLKGLKYGRFPKAVQEGIVGYCALTHPNDPLPIPIDKKIYDTTMSYLSTISQTGNMLAPSLDTPPYCYSYWHYHALSTKKTKKRP